MNNSLNQPIGKIVLHYDKKNCKQDKIVTAVELAKKMNIDLMPQELSENRGYVMVLEIIEIGQISNLHMTELFNVILEEPGKSDFIIKVFQEDKNFYLPDDLDECLDWFIIE